MDYFLIQLFDTLPLASSYNSPGPILSHFSHIIYFKLFCHPNHITPNSNRITP